MVLVDLRPDAVDLLIRAGRTVQLDLVGPAGWLTGRTFTSTLNGTPLTVTPAGDVLTITASQAITEPLPNLIGADWLLLEDLGGASPEERLIGTWTPSDDPRAVTSRTVDVSVDGTQLSLGLPAAVTSHEAAGSHAQLAVNGVGVTGTPGAIRGDGILLVNGILLTEGDHIHRTAEHMHGSGTLITDPTAPGRLPRWLLPDGATHSVKWVFDIPFEWQQVDLVIGWNKEAAVSGDVELQFDYRWIMPFTGDLVDDASELVTVALGAVAAPSTSLAWDFLIPAAIQNITVPTGPFSEKPMMLCTLTRFGAVDSLAAAVAISTAIANRFV